VFAFCSIGCGVALAAKAGDDKRRRRQVAGSVFLLGFVLLGVALSQWHAG
jgi:hypothetical protein